MQRGNVSNQLILSDDSIWRTPHVVQSMRRGELRWDEFLRVLIRDLAFGTSREKWIDRLFQEGNIGLAGELVERLGLEGSTGAPVKLQEHDWQEMVELARDEAAQYIKQNSDEVTQDDIEAYEELLDMATEYVDEKAYGDAVSTLEQARKVVESSIERRRAAAAAAFAATEARVSKARATFAAAKVARFPGGPTEHARTKELLLKADDQLYRKNYTAAKEIAEWVEAMCKGQDYSAKAVEELLSIPFVVEPIGAEAEPELEDEALAGEPEEELEFERSWTREDDEHLVDNYDVMSNAQLNLRFHATEAEIQRRLQYLGLVHDRETGKRVRWKNPYVAGKPLRGKRVFVGREDVFSFIEDSLGSYHEDEDRNLVVLLGHRRTGKTSILLQLRKHRREILEPRIPIFVDIEGLLPFPRGLRNFFWKLACCIQEEIEDLEGIRLPRPTVDKFAGDSAWKFQEFLHQAKQAVGDKGLILMLDEFQALEPRLSSLDVGVYKMLRSVIQHDPQVDFILSGTMEMDRMVRDYQAAMFGSAISKKIDFLDEKDARKLILLPVQSHITYNQDAVDLIVEVTASHPYFVQLICWTLMRYLVDRGKSKVSAYDVERILPMALERGVHFDEIWATDTTELELYVMAIVGELAPERGNWCKVSAIESKLEREGQMPNDPDDFDEAILNLTNRRIFRRSADGGAVRFQVDVFGQWVHTNKPFEVVRRDIRAEAAARRRRAERQPMSY
jgi:hypothetical protein